MDPLPPFKPLRGGAYPFHPRESEAGRLSSLSEGRLGAKDRTWILTSYLDSTTSNVG